MKLETPCQIKAGKLILDRAKLSDAIKNLADGWYWLTIQSKHKNRTNKENAYYWGVVVVIASACLSSANGCHVGGDNAHEILKMKCNPDTKIVAGIETIYGSSTKNLTTVDFEAYCQRCRDFLYEYFNAIVPLPNE